MDEERKVDIEDTAANDSMANVVSTPTAQNGGGCLRSCVMILSILLLLLICGVAFFFWLNRDNALNLGNRNKVELSPTQVKSLEEIGEWEFLCVNDEEIVDTVRHGFFSDDELVRIYYGSLRLGIDMREVKEDWIKMEKDTVVATLPRVRLLDEDFIDEARTKAFYESGTWSDADRERLYEKAKKLMKKRCLTKSNIESAERNASAQFHNLLTSMGFQYVRVRVSSK